MSEPYWVALGAAPLDYEGEWSAATSYVAGDIVTRSGINYLAVNPSTNQVPPLMSADGGIPLTMIDAKGDMVVGLANDTPSRLPVGTAGQVLIADPTQPGGVRWGAAGAALTGDTKVSMQTASHADPGGGQWLLADGSAIPGQYTALIALCGANLPDAKGRGLVMVGTNADVNAIGKSDGVAAASRSPKHKSSVADPGHAHTARMSNTNASDNTTFGPTLGNGAVNYAPSSITAAGTGVTVGPAASAMIDTPSYVVVGNLFVHT